MKSLPFQIINQFLFSLFSIRLTYDEAIELINKIQNHQPAEYGKDLSAYHEMVLLEYFEHQPLFITHFPIELRPFYMKSEGDKVRKIN